MKSFGKKNLLLHAIFKFCTTKCLFKSNRNETRVWCFSFLSSLVSSDIYMCENVSFGSTVIPRIFGCFVVGNVWLFNLSDRIYAIFSWVWCKKCGGSFACVYIKIVSGSPFICFVNELLGPIMFGVRYSDCYVINICYNKYVFWGSGISEV